MNPVCNCFLPFFRLFGGGEEPVLGFVSLCTALRFEDCFGEDVVGLPGVTDLVADQFMSSTDQLLSSIDQFLSLVPDEQLLL